jgi:carboxyl-terminal processing protease
MTSRPLRAFGAVVAFLSVCALGGALLERRVGAQSAADEGQFRDSLKSFTSVYALVEQNYADPIDGDKVDTAIYDGAIPGMLIRTRIFTIPSPTPRCARTSTAATTAWAC